MNTLLRIMTGLAILLSFSSCSVEKDFSDTADASKKKVLNIHVADGNETQSATRAQHVRFVTTFESGDAIGVYVVDENRSVVMANVKVVLNAGVWTPEESIEYSPDYSYYAYFPWKASPTNGPAVNAVLSADNVDTGFHNMIDSWTINSDQSTEAKFEESDLLMAKATVSDMDLDFSMSHKMGLAYWDSKAYKLGNRIIEDPSAVINSESLKPYNPNAKVYYVCKPGETYSFDFCTVTGPAEGRYYNNGTFVAFEAKNYLRFTPTLDTQFTFTKAGLSYSLDNGQTWTALSANTKTPTVRGGQSIIWKNNTTLSPSSGSGIGRFMSSSESTRIKISGNIMSLLYGDDFENKTSLSGYNYAFEGIFCMGSYTSTPEYASESNAKNMVEDAGDLILPATTLSTGCYKNMFQGCRSLTAAPELPATTLADYCYTGMFVNCINGLTAAPELPATTLANRCYTYMFASCKALTTAPELPATTLTESCYGSMFSNCTSLTTPPELPATTMASGCYSNMFSNCTALTTPPRLPATTLAPYCYYYMFYFCTSLTTTPQLPAITLADNCYRNMFYHCVNLTNADDLRATTLATECYNNMFYECTALTTAPEILATTVAQSCCSNMFYGCTALTTPPTTLPATSLAIGCYSSMFYGCTSLTTAPELPATTLQSQCYQSMFRGCTSLTTAPELPATTLVSNCYNYMFQNCSSLNYIKAAFTTTPSGGNTYNWVSGVSATGTFYKNAAATWNVSGNNGIPSGWTVNTYTP